MANPEKYPPEVMAAKFGIGKLTRHLFAWDPQARYMDYYERALINHILASQDPDTGRVMYYVPLRTGAQKQFQTLFDSFTCCVGTGMENHARYGESIDGVMISIADKAGPPSEKRRGPGGPRQPCVRSDRRPCC